jgi:FtsH-binding integral membrane protein
MLKSVNTYQKSAYLILSLGLAVAAGLLAGLLMRGVVAGIAIGVGVLVLALLGIILIHHQGQPSPPPTEMHYTAWPAAWPLERRSALRSASRWAIWPL